MTAESNVAIPMGEFTIALPCGKKLVFFRKEASKPMAPHVSRPIVPLVVHDLMDLHMKQSTADTHDIAHGDQFHSHASQVAPEIARVLYFNFT